MIASPLGILFSLATGIALSCYYLFNKKVSSAGSPLQIIFWIFLAHIPPLMVWAALTHPLFVDSLYFLPGMAVLTLTILGNFLMVRAISLSPLSLVIPVMSLTPVFTSLIGIPLLQEFPSPTQGMGIALSVLGVLWLYAPPERPWDIFSFWGGFFRERGAPSMMLSALAWSVSAPMDKIALRHASPAFHALFVFCGLSLFLFAWLALRGEWKRPSISRPFWSLVLFTGAAGALTDILQLFSLIHTPVGTFESIKRVSSQLLALVFGYILFREEMTKPKLIGIAILSVGVPLIVL